MISGIYRHDNQFFRFYRDGLFLDCLIVVSPAEEEGLAAQITRWFHRGHEHPGVLRGTYSMTGNRMLFHTPGHFGDGQRLVEYRGVFRNDRLVLDSVDQNTGHQTKGVMYVRLPVDHLPTRNDADETRGTGASEH